MRTGGTAFPLTGVTLQAGITYTVRLDASDFNQSWTAGGPYLAGLCSDAPSIDAVPDIASSTFTVDRNNGPDPMRFRTESFTVTPSETVTDPHLLLRTCLGGSANQRIGFDRVTTKSIAVSKTPASSARGAGVANAWARERTEPFRRRYPSRSAVRGGIDRQG